MIVGQLSICLWGSKQRKVRVNYVLLRVRYEVDTDIDEVEGRRQKVEKREKKKVDGEESVDHYLQFAVITGLGQSNPNGCGCG